MLVYVRPSNEALLRARVPGAQDQHGCPSNPFIVGALRARRTVCLLPRIILRPRCGSTEDHRAYPFLCSTSARRQWVFPQLAAQRL